VRGESFTPAGVKPPQTAGPAGVKPPQTVGPAGVKPSQTVGPGGSFLPPPSKTTRRLKDLLGGGRPQVLPGKIPRRPQVLPGKIPRRPSVLRGRGFPPRALRSSFLEIERFNRGKPSQT